jgi:deoxyribonuclease-4
VPALRFGYHVSVAGDAVTAIRRGAAAGCEAIQMFPGSPQQWGTLPATDEQALEFRDAREQAGIDPVVLHSIYLVNMASPSEQIYKRSTHSLASALDKADALGAAAVVTHIGNHKGEGEDYGVARIAAAVAAAFEKSPGDAMLLLETTAGAGTAIGNSFEQFGRVFEAAGWPARLGFCLDTCHAYAAGYDVSTPAGVDETLAELDRFVGLDRLRLVHMNDSKGSLGSHLDRHADIGEGLIGLEGFRYMVNHEAFRGLAAIVEVPYERPGAPDNLRILRSLIDS